MSKFSVSDKVQFTGSNELGTVVKVYPKMPGRQLYDVVLESGLKKMALESNLMPVIDLDDPFDCCGKGLFGSSSDFASINTSYKIRNTNNNTVSSLKASKTIFKAYQFKPLLKFLNSRNHRILIADEVGLGKTIEAGHIMLELSARRELNNALIVCPKSLIDKWQMELKDKFDLDFQIYDSLKQLTSDLKTKNGFIRGIVNYEKLRERDDDTFFDELDTSYKKFDFILCDEAHRLRNSDTKQYHGMARLLESPCAAVFLTATPVMISQENLFNLLCLLDPDQYGEYSVFLNSLSVNAPFISAISDLNANKPYREIKEFLENAEVETYYTIGDDYYYRMSGLLADRFKDSPLFQRILKGLDSGDESPESKVRLQFELSSMSPMNNIFSRTRKKEITTDWAQAERDTHTIIVHLEDNERCEFDAVVNEYDDGLPGRDLGLIQRKRQVSSSIYAYLNDRDDLINGIDLYEDYPDAKVTELVRIIEAVKADRRLHLIVFAVFKDTLRYLAIRLSKLGYNTIQIHGDIKPGERIGLLQDFKNSDSFTILLSSEVGSEGLDLQFCNCMVNYDLPWNPMVVEQRIGRIDRFGQQSPKVHIYNLVVENSIQVDIYERLLDRIGIFKNCIGDLEAILDKDLEQNGIRNIQEWFNKLEAELYCNNLSKEERQAKIDAIALAMETESHNLDEVSKGLVNTLTNDAYFKNEIESIDKHNRYLTAAELYNYIKLLIETKLPSCILAPANDSGLVYTLKIPQSEPRLVTNFLDEYYPLGKGNDLEILNRQFKGRITDITEVSLTFDQQTAYDSPKLEFINAYHPLVTSAYLYFEKNKRNTCKAFSFTLNANDIDAGQSKLSREYFMVIYVLKAEKYIYNSQQKLEQLIPVLYDAETACIVDDRNLTEAVFAAAQTSIGVSKRAALNMNPDFVLNMQIAFEETISAIRATYIAEQREMIETYKDMQLRQYRDYYDAQLSYLERTLQRHQEESQSGTEEQRRNANKVLPLDKSKIERKKRERDNALDVIQKAKVVESEHELISLSHIDIV